jgi:hypothetical protein
MTIIDFTAARAAVTLLKKTRRERVIDGLTGLDGVTRQQATAFIDRYTIATLIRMGMTREEAIDWIQQQRSAK